MLDDQEPNRGSRRSGPLRDIFTLQPLFIVITITIVQWFIYIFQASATSRLFQFLAIGWIILVRFPNPLAFGSQTGTPSRFYPFNWSKLNGSLYIVDSGAQVKMCRLYGRTSIKIDGKNSDAARISNLCAGSSIAAAHSVEVKLRIDSLTVAAKRQPHNVQ